MQLTIEISIPDEAAAGGIEDLVQARAEQLARDLVENSLPFTLRYAQDGELVEEWEIKAEDD